MATVRLSMSMREQIYKKALGAFDAARPTPDISAEMKDFIVDSIKRSPYYSFLQQCSVFSKDFSSPSSAYPTMYFLDIEELKVSEVAQIEVRMLFNIDESLGLNKPDSTLRITRFGDHTYAVKFDSPKTFLTANKHQMCSDVSTKALLHEDAERIDAALNDRLVKSKALYKVRQDYSDQINSLLNNCTTLKQLLSVWPKCEVFVPQEAMDRHNVMPEKKKRVEVTAESVGFDLDAVNSIAVRARLKGAI